MRYVPVFKGIIAKGRLILSEVDKYNAYLSSLGGDVEVIVRVPRKDRSSAENKYYWSVIVGMISQETGHETEEIHEILKGLFLTQHTEILGIGADYVKSTTKLSTVEAEDYFSKCRAWASEFLHMYIPEPNELEVER